MGQGSKLALMALVSGGCALALPAWAQESSPVDAAIDGVVLELSQASPTQITDVRLEETDAGLQVVLETTEGELSAPTTVVSGNALIIEIENAVLTGEDFEQFEPAEGIAVVQVSALSGDRVQVTITGTDTVPVADVSTDAAGLTLSVVPGIAQAGETSEPLRIVVTGEEDEGYNPSSASTATRTDTPLRDIPQSIQVVPRQVIEDRNVRTVNEAVETVSGVIDGGDTIARIFRGFVADGNGISQLRNGYRIGDTNILIPEEPTVAIEQVEVLKGPASVLFGALEPGGIINVITKKPLSEPYYELGFEAGNRGFYQPSIDLSGPLNGDKTALYRLIAAYNTSDGYFNGGEENNTLIAPSLTLNLGDKTSLDLHYEYSRFAGDLYGGLATVARSDGSLLPRDVNVWGNPDLTFDDRESHRYGFALEHDFNNNLQLRAAFSANNQNVPEQRFAVPIGLVDDRFVEFFYLDRTISDDIYFGQIDLIGKFSTGSISHQLLGGFDYENAFQNFRSFTSREPLPLLDSLNPDYDVERPTDLVQDFTFERQAENYGVYLQDQIELSDSWKVLIGGRYDWASYDEEVFLNDTDEPVINDDAFSPRVGLVYQPSDTVSLYASYSRSFSQTREFNPDGELFEPTRGTQYEIGARADFLDGRLSGNLAAYHLTRTNITTPDPNNPDFSIQTGEARSQGIELDVTGEILPGWNIVTSYAYTDAEVTEDNSIPIGNQLNNVPFNQASLWTTYEIQGGDLEGLGFGLGLFYIGERQGDLDNSFELDDYLRTDAALYYRKERFNAAINIRNLFDIDYASFGNSSTYIQRGAPFTITGSISWEF
ncbi:MAG: TonB-dependent siderophore receptor [Cyanobacteria bacterium P01_D01_bin.56]